MCEIKLKRGADVLEGIYSWCGFKWLEIKLELTTRTTTNFEIAATETKSLRYSDTQPGWLSLPPLFFHPYMHITISFVEKITIPADYNSIQIRTLTLQNSERLVLARTIEIFPIIPDDTARKFLSLFPLPKEESLRILIDDEC